MVDVELRRNGINLPVEDDVKDYLSFHVIEDKEIVEIFQRA
jgi:hypothetical protein